ncbi:uncharacterized protein PV07_12831 [Cladophialophora immunda]|uniref:Transcription factor domain-containing protein n=1 Tax=Cladophialophora immunda TaxID=569365 RepID=A0A0D2CDV3_9EURO|nr:uncharacterized protein PV07_12831 [Cladophialophora immunda]KIW21739.1 hypothetical protein PV07_12831 [Cladophialophora immunda]
MAAVPHVAPAREQKRSVFIMPEALPRSREVVDLLSSVERRLEKLEQHQTAPSKTVNYYSTLQPHFEILGQLTDNDTGIFNPGFQATVPAEISVSALVACINSVFEGMDGFPFFFRHLFQYGGLSKEVCLGLFPAVSSNLDSILFFGNLTPEQLLVQAMALKYNAAITRSRELDEKADLSFRGALEKMWVVQPSQSLQALSCRFLFVAMLLYLYGRPHESLLALQNVLNLLHGVLSQRFEEPTSLSQLEACSLQYFILEIDVLSVTDGMASGSLRASVVAAATTPLNLSTNGPIAVPVDHPGFRERLAHLELRACMDTIQAYNLGQTYSSPQQDVAIVSEVLERLDRWHSALPGNLKFPRYPDTFGPASTDVTADAMVSKEALDLWNFLTQLG